MEPARKPTSDESDEQPLYEQPLLKLIRTSLNEGDDSQQLSENQPHTIGLTHETSDITDSLESPTPDTMPSTSEKSTKTSKKPQGMLAHLDSLITNYLSTSDYNPGETPVSLPAELDHKLYQIYQVLRGDFKREVKHGRKIRVQKVGTWNNRTKILKQLMYGSNDSKGLLDLLEEAQYTKKIYRFTAFNRMHLLDKMLKTSITNNKYLKKVYGDGLKDLAFYINAKDSVNEFEDEVRKYDYDRGTIKSRILWGIKKWKKNKEQPSQHNYKPLEAANNIQTIEYQRPAQTKEQSKPQLTGIRSVAAALYNLIPTIRFQREI